MQQPADDPPPPEPRGAEAPAFDAAGQDGPRDRFFELGRDLLAILDGDGCLERANVAWEERLGRPREELVGRPFLELVHPDDRTRFRVAFDAARRGVPGDRVELRVLDASGDARWIEWAASCDDDSGRMYVAAHDVTAARAAEEALRRSADRYRLLFDEHPLPMMVCDPATLRILAVNDAAVRQYGYRRDELLAGTVDRVLAPDAPRVLQSGVHRHIRKNGSVVEVDVTAHAIHDEGRPQVLVMAVDVSDRRQLEEQLEEALRLEAIGRLAGGIAHDFNNLLTAINGYSQLLLSSLDAGDPRRDDAQQIHLAGQRAASLTSQLLAFSRRQLLQPEVIDLNELVQDIVPMLRRLLGARVTLRMALRASTPFVVADRARLEQVVVNLCVNARDAMPEGGTVTIRTGGLELPVARRLGDEVIDPGSYVELSVRDTGHGMDEATRRRVFEPFFTTKEPTRGTGLGLATAYGTVRQSGGHIRVRSRPGRGTTFAVLLPRAAEEAVSDVAPSGGRPESAERRGTVLLVEDEPQVRQLAERVLADAGYQVLTAADGTEALELAAATSGLDLLLTDLVMPGSGGVDVAEAVGERHPGTPVLFMSGYPRDDVLGPGGIDTGIELLAKPFSADELLRRVRDLTGATRGGPRDRLVTDHQM